VTTEPVGAPETMPALFIAGVTAEANSPLLWMRSHQGALMWGGTYATHPRDILVDAELPERFDDVPLDGVLECQRLAAQAEDWIPLLRESKSLTVKHGAYCTTPDSRSLVGPMPGIKGLYVLAGDNETGITHGPGFGKALAEHISTGASSLTSIEAWRVDRFGRDFASQSEILQAVTELQASGDLS